MLGRVHSKIDFLTALKRDRTNKLALEKHYKGCFCLLRQSSSFKVGIVGENVNKILYHPVAEVILFL